MPTFEYRAINAQGRYSNGRIEAADAAQARTRLRGEGLRPVDLKDISSGSMAAANTAATPRVAAQHKGKPVDIDSLKLGRQKMDKLCYDFISKLYQLVASGLPLGDAIRSLTVRLSEPTLRAVCDRIWQQLSEGASLAAAMRSLPRVFDPTVSSMIEAGEATGHLKGILENVMELLESRLKLRKEIVGGLSYPAFILSIVFLVVLFVLFYLMPLVEGMLDNMGGELALSARLIMGLAHFAITFGPFIAVGLLIIGVIIFQWYKTPDGRLFIDRLILRTPIVKNVALNAELSRLSNLAAILLGSGVDAPEAMKLIERAISNQDIRNRFHASLGMIKDGASFSQSFERAQLLPDMDLDILSVSENTGNLVTGFGNIYRNRHTALGEQMKKMTAILSTGALFVAFAIVSMVVFGIVSSIMQLSKNVLN